MASKTVIVDKIDKALGTYYKRLNQPYYDDEEESGGKFKGFCDENGFEDTDLKLEFSAGAQECMLVDFHVDDDDNNLFPLDPPIHTKEDKNNEIYRIIKYCHDYGIAPIPQPSANKKYKNVFDIEIDSDVITGSIIKTAKKKYKNQVFSCLGNVGIKEKDLMYFLSVGIANNGYPFLTHIVDSYTRDRVLQRSPSLKNKLTAAQWSKTNPYMLKVANRDKVLANSLESAIKAYCNRISPKIQFTHLYKVDDSLQEISEYITASIQFILKLLKNQKSAAPFQVDLLVAVKNVVNVQNTAGPTFDDDDSSNESDDTDSSDDSDDESDSDNDEFKNDSLNIDWIGNVEEKLDAEDCIHTKPKYYVDDGLKEVNDEGPRSRFMNDIYNEFRGKLQKRPKNHDKKKKHKKKKNKHKPNSRLPFQSRTYPQKKRFCIFVDRREAKNNDGDHHDRVSMYEPPYVCDTIPHNHVAEWYFESVRQCIIPRKGYGDGENEAKLDLSKKSASEKASLSSITSRDDVCGQLITFSFHVEAEDQIACYLYWSGQTQRFYPQDIIQLLPYLFVDNKANKKFKKHKAPSIIQKMKLRDFQFEQFYNEIKKNKRMKFPQTAFKSNQ